MQSAGNLVRVVIELAAGMEFCQHDFRRRLSFLRHDLRRNAAAVVDDGYGTIDVDDDMNFRAISRERFVDGVVDNFVDEVVKPVDTREPMYMAGRLRTASRPSRTLICSAP